MNSDDNNNEALPRIIDAEILEAGLDKRSKYLDDYLNERRSTFDVAIAAGANLPKNQRARQFGDLLAKDSRDLLAYERQHAIHTNWNDPQEEENMCRRTTELGQAYYLASSAAERLAVVAECLAAFTHVPMVVEEMAEEERSIRGHGWEDTPIEERRVWAKVWKSLRRLPSTKAAPGFPRRPIPEHHLGLATAEVARRNSKKEKNSSTTPQQSSQSEQNPPRTPARKRFAEIRRVKSRR